MSDGKPSEIILQMRRDKFGPSSEKTRKADDGGERSAAETGRAYCDRLFTIEDDLRDLSAEDRYKQRLECEKPVLDAFWSWLETVNPLRGSKLAKAVVYAQNQKRLWRTISWTEDYPCQTMLPKMPSGHSWRGVKTGCLQILQKEQPHQLQSAT